MSLVAPHDVAARGPWIVLADGVWGNMSGFPHRPVFAPAQRDDAEAASWLELVGGTNTHVTLRNGKLRAHAAGFLYLEGRDPVTQ